MHLTVAEALAATSTCAAGWLMVKAGTAKRALRLRGPARCPSCGRHRTAAGCRCTRTG